MTTQAIVGTGVAVPESEPGLSQLERVVDTFVAPAKTFEDIRRNASWWLPFLLLMFSSLAVSWTVDKQVGFDRVYQTQMHASAKAEDRLNALDPAQKERTMRMGTASMRYSTYGFPLILLIVLSLYSLFLWAGFNFGLGAATTYKQVLAVTWYAALPYLLTSLITFLTVHFGNNADAYDLRNPVGTNLGYYLTDAPATVKAALSSIDLIKLWSVALQVIGMSIIARKSMAQSAMIVGIFWVLGVLMGVAGAAFS